jgi:hypothetical protein
MVDDGDFHSDAAAVHDAAWTVLADAADLVAARSRRFTLDEVCVELGVDPDRIRERAARMREEDGDV